ncbi:aminotransferase class V-fold PLP-dependent enzyme [Nocardioides sp. zg-536]|uniref:Aminotransferase class V-fold PLP-dependent enzyme n=1 Tax=Nocardioides faecalis TaxID=2803858 RepID=A0A938Y9M9_9ACTN|nr:aminotransferase class V-fold PLP-dependent enzyme [Nocardioides faecalis]MBM9460395.1 aminotransferase class V-fold PLP-dependent enzyme [Nocardioides faecalis]QVI59779.1 aminotransferase class V-fold PLP-dependent enzyme [Nocardioides faecalis]
MTRLPDPAALAAHYSRFAVAERLLLTGHSHQAWPDVAREGQVQAYDDAALAVDTKWERAFAKAEAVRSGVRALLGEADADVALGASTHELLVRLLSALDLQARPRLVTTDGEFHSARRQLDRLGEAGVEVVTVPAAPVTDLADRLAAQLDDRTAAVVVSSVMYETAHLVPGLDALARRAERHGVELVVDAYHHLGVAPLDLAETGLTGAWVLGGGYKYLQLGEGNCFLRVPGHAEGLRPLVTGWYAESGDLQPDPTDTSADTPAVAYARGAAAFAGASYDPTSHYRAAAVLDFFADQGLTPPVLRGVSLHQRGLLAAAVDDLDLPEDVLTRDRETPAAGFAGFLSLRSPYAARLSRGLAERGVHADSRGEHLRLGPAPYLRDDQLLAAVAALGEAALALH